MDTSKTAFDGYCFVQEEGDFGEWINLRHAQKVSIARQSQTEFVLIVDFGEEREMTIRDPKEVRRVARLLGNPPAILT